MHHHFYNCNTKPPAERPTDIVGFYWSSQKASCYIGRMYDGSKFRFRNYAIARRLAWGRLERRPRAERIKKARDVAAQVAAAFAKKREEERREKEERAEGQACDI